MVPRSVAMSREQGLGDLGDGLQRERALKPAKGQGASSSANPLGRLQAAQHPHGFGGPELVQSADPTFGTTDRYRLAQPLLRPDELG